MPTYEYRCTSCGQHIEVVQSFSDDPLTECGACGGALRKVFAPVGIVFKGSGFYRTDSRSGGGATRKKEEKKDGATSSSSTESSSSSSTESSSSSSSAKSSKIA